jgi:hypothetical protein
LLSKKNRRLAGGKVSLEDEAIYFIMSVMADAI